MSGACNSVPASAMASVAIAPGMFLAHSVVPSSGSTAMSTLGPVLLPTFSPMNSIGASSISPSPITTVPSIDSVLSSRRMASTAAWSVFFSAPRPRNRAAATAARSVTRTISSARARSIEEACATVIDAIFCPLVLLDPDHLRPARDYTVAAHGDEGLAHRILAGRIRDHDDGHRLARTCRPGTIVALHDGFDRNILLRQPPRNGRRATGAIAREEADIVAAFVVLHRRFADRRHARRRPPERRRADAAGDVGEIGHHGGRR